jgi:hypothetical protein
MGLAEYVWLDKRKSIAQSVDNLGDQFRPAMGAGWVSYITRVYREEEGATDVGLVAGEDTFVVADWVYAAHTAPCYKHCSSAMDHAIGL